MGDVTMSPPQKKIRLSLLLGVAAPFSLCGLLSPFICCPSFVWGVLGCNGSGVYPGHRVERGWRRGAFFGGLRCHGGPGGEQFSFRGHTFLFAHESIAHALVFFVSMANIFLAPQHLPGAPLCWLLVVSYSPRPSLLPAFFFIDAQ